MRNSLLTLFVVCLFGTFAAMAQDSTAASSQSTTTQSTTTTTTTPNSTDQSGQTSAMPANQGAANDATQTSAGEQSIDGCLMKDGSSYSIQPASGGAKTELTPSRSLDSFVGQHIRVSGSDQGGQLTVARIQPVSASCDSAAGTAATPSSTPPQQ